MQLYGPSGTRAFPHDRAPLRVDSGGGTLIVGGNDIVLATYTVPASRRALIQTAEVHGVVTTALAAGQTGKYRIEHGAAGSVVGSIIWRSAEPLGTRDRSRGGPYFLTAGQTLRIRATLAAGAGTIDTEAGLQGVEYDA